MSGKKKKMNDFLSRKICICEVLFILWVEGYLFFIIIIHKLYELFIVFIVLLFYITK